MSKNNTGYQSQTNAMRSFELKRQHSRPTLIYILTPYNYTKASYTSSTNTAYCVISYYDWEEDDLKKKLFTIFKRSMNSRRKEVLICSSIEDDEDQIDAAAFVNVSRLLNGVISDFVAQKLTTSSTLQIIHEAIDLRNVVVNKDDFLPKVENIYKWRNGVTCKAGCLFADFVFMAGSTYTTALFERNREGTAENFKYRCTYDPIESLKIEQGPLKLEDNWWFNEWVKPEAPVCAFGRLTQQSTTCWWNTIMNTLMLTDESADILVENWEKLPNKDRFRLQAITLKTCPMMNMPMHDFLYVLINQILVLGIKPREANGDISSAGAWHAYNAILPNKRMPFSFFRTPKNVPLIGKFPFYVSSKKGSAHNPVPASSTYMYAQVALFPVLRAVMTIGQQYNIISTTCVEQRGIQKTGEFDWTYNRRNRHLSCKEHDGWSKFSHPRLVFIVPTFASFMTFCDNRRSAEQITINGNRYILKSAGLYYSMHYVAGLTCDHNGISERYIYDSNNFLTTDNWPSGLTPKYTAVSQEYRADKTVRYKGVAYQMYVAVN